MDRSWTRSDFFSPLVSVSCLFSCTSRSFLRRSITIIWFSSSICFVSSSQRLSRFSMVLQSLQRGDRLLILECGGCAKYCMQMRASISLLAYVLMCFLSLEFSIISLWLDLSKSDMLISMFSYIRSRVSLTSRKAVVCLVKCYADRDRNNLKLINKPLLSDRSICRPLTSISWA